MRGKVVQKYQPLNLAERLQAFRNQKFTGLVCFQSDQAPLTGDTQKFFASFLSGGINYIGIVTPDLDTIANQLIENLEHPFFKMSFRIAREQSKGSESAQKVLSKVVSTRIVTWEQIKTAMQSQAESTLRLIAQSSGKMTSEPNAGSDLAFGDDGHGLDWLALKKTLESPTSQASSEQPSESSLQSTVEERSINPSLVTPGNLAPDGATAARAINLPTILSVDDSPIVQKMIQRTLSQECNVLLADNALVALKILNKVEEISLVLLDVNMPGVSGLDFCRTLRGIPQFKDLPVIMLTANEGRISKAMGQIAGSTLYLTKPVDDQKLISIIREYTSADGAAPGQSSQASLSAA